MIKRLLLLLCLMLTAGSAAWAEIAHGDCKRGSWVIDDSGKLTVNINGDMADYSEGKAPWYGYADQITAIHIGSGCKNVGRNGFYGLDQVTKVTGGENVEACAMYSFEECGVGKLIPEIYLPKCTYVGECAFRSCGALRIVLPVVKEVRTRAFASSPYLIQIDLGSKIEEIGVLAFSECPQMWADNTPNIFMSNPTPPKLYTKVDADVTENIKIFFKNLGIGAGLTLLSCLPFVGVACGYGIGQMTTKNKINDAAEKGELMFAWDGLRLDDGTGYGSSGGFYDLAVDQPFTMSSCYSSFETDKWYNPFSPRPDGKGWTEGEPIICVPANLVKTYRDYYYDAENMKPGNYGYIDDDAEGMGTNGDRSKSAHGAIMAGGKIGTTLDEGFWMLQYRNSNNELVADPAGTDDALVVGGKNISTSAVNSVKSQAKALYIASNSTFLEGAFQDWTNLEYVYMANGSVINSNMFKGCTNLKEFEGYPATTIYPSAFEDCTKLHSFVDKGSSISSVAASAFKGCTSLYEVKLPRVKVIQKEAFKGCSYLRNVYSSGSLSKNLAAQYDIETIGESAFEGCSALYDISLQNLQNLGKRAFYGCKDLQEFSPGPYFSVIPEEAFANSGLLRVRLNGANSYSFASKSFANCTNMTNTGLSANERGIFDSNGDYGRVGDIASDAFEGLELKNIPLHTSYAAYSRYENNNKLNQMQFMPYDVNYMRWSVESNGWELTYSGILTVGKNYPALYKTEPEEYDWYPYRDLIKKVMVEDGVTQISKSEFEGLTRVTDVHIPRSVKIISEGAFRGCTSLRNIYITRVENIGSYAFEGCSSLETIELDENLKRAGDYIFKNCTSLTDITNKEETPAVITELTFKDIKSPVYDSRRNAMGKAGETSTVNLHVPRYAVLNYMIDENWSKLHIDYADDRGTWEKAGKFGDGSWILYDDGTMVVCANKGYTKGNSYEVAQKELKFADNPNNPKDTDPILLTKRLEIDGNIAELGAYFCNFKNLEEVVLKAPVHTLDGTFWACEKLASITTANLDTIKANTFYNTALTNLSLPQAKLIESYAFGGCSKLQTVQLGPSCELKVGVFQNCTSLTDIDLSTAQVGHGTNLFKNCTSLKGVIFHGTEVGTSMFEGCTALEEIDLGENCKKVGNYAFGGCTALKTIYVSSPTPPSLMKSMEDVTIDGTTQHVQVSPFKSSDLSGEIDYKQIEVQVPNTFIIAYTSAMNYLWREMKIVKDEDYEEELLPTGGLLSGYDANGKYVFNGFKWNLDAEGLLTIDGSGDMPAYRNKNNDGLDSDRYWLNTFAPWLYFIKTVEVTDDVTSVADYLFAIHDEDIENSSAGVTTIILGEKFNKAGYMAFPFSGIKDVYVYSEDLVNFDLGCFNREALTANNATLHVLKHSENKYLNYYKTHAPTSYFPNIVADLEAKDPKVEAVSFDMAELTMYVGQSIQLEPQFTPSNVKNKTLRYKNILNNYNVNIDEDGVITAWNEGYAYIEAYSSYTVDGNEVQALWGPDQLTYLKVTITAEPQKEHIFFNVFAYEATDAPWTSFHVLRDEQINVDTQIKTCEVAGQFNEDDVTTQAIPEWRTGTVIIPEEAEGYEVVRLGAFSFYERNIRVLYIPWTVKEIGYNACARCDYLTDVYVTSYEPLKFTDAYGDPMEESMGHNDAFYRIGEGDDGEGYATLHVPAGSKEAWDIYPWNEWFRFIVEDVEIPDGIKDLNDTNDFNGFNYVMDSWFDLSGRRLGSKPTAPGLYINNGKKIVIK